MLSKGSIKSQSVISCIHRNRIFLTLSLHISHFESQRGIEEPPDFVVNGSERVPISHVPVSLLICRQIIRMSLLCPRWADIGVIERHKWHQRLDR